MTSLDGPEYVSAREAAEMLGVRLSTLYVYVGRKGLRSQAVPGTRERRYWRADIEALIRPDRPQAPVRGEVKRESALTLITDRGPFYRGRSAVELSETATLEEVAAHLWGVDAAEVFTEQPPRTPASYDRIGELLAEQGAVGRAAALFHLMEEADPRSHDLSPTGLARTGADVVRTLAALVLRAGRPGVAPLHRQVAEVLQLEEAQADLVRRMFVLGCDHGFEPGAYAVRAVASTGVSPWRSVATGLAVLTGRRSGFGRFHTVRRFLSEMLDQSDPRNAVIRRAREGERLPGFDSTLYPAGDPRALALLEGCRIAFAERREMRDFEVAIETAREVGGASPDFALVCQFAEFCFGMDARDSLFLIARSVGWVAHSIEQYASGEAEHREGRYSGPLPS